LSPQSFVDAEGLERIEESAQEVAVAVEASKFVEAVTLYFQTTGIIAEETNNVNMYNVLAQEDIYFPDRTANVTVKSESNLKLCCTRLYRDSLNYPDSRLHCLSPN